MRLEFRAYFKLKIVFQWSLQTLKTRRNWLNCLNQSTQKYFQRKFHFNQSALETKTNTTSFYFQIGFKRKLQRDLMSLLFQCKTIAQTLQYFHLNFLLNFALQSLKSPLWFSTREHLTKRKHIQTDFLIILNLHQFHWFMT